MLMSVQPSYGIGQSRFSTVQLLQWRIALLIRIHNIMVYNIFKPV